MSTPDHRLERLLQAAAQAPRPVDTVLPLGFQTRVLAKWRASADQPSLTGLLNRAMLACFALAILTVAFSYENWFDTSSASTVLSVADTAIEISFP